MRWGCDWAGVRLAGGAGWGEYALTIAAHSTSLLPTTHCSRLTTLLTTHLSPNTTLGSHELLLTTQYPQLTTNLSRMTSNYALLTTHYLPLTPYYSQHSAIATHTNHQPLLTRSRGLCFLFSYSLLLASCLLTLGGRRYDRSPTHFFEIGRDMCAVQKARVSVRHVRCS